jgi:hypothetical protein
MIGGMPEKAVTSTDALARVYQGKQQVRSVIEIWMVPDGA